MVANYHTHTVRCGHASGSEREYIERAIARGLKVLGFSDHTPYPFHHGDYYSSFRMRVEQTAEYFDTLRSLQREYAGQITLYMGCEAEYYPACFDDLLRLLRGNGCQYLLLGQHFIRNEYDGVYSAVQTDDEAVLEQYARQTTEALRTGCFTYFAHPDLVRYTGPDAIYERHMRPLCRVARELDIPLEINFLGISDHRHYPSRRFFALAAEEGCKCIFGCDAHNPDAVADPVTLATAQAFADSLSLTVVDSVELKRL